MAPVFLLGAQLRFLQGNYENHSVLAAPPEAKQKPGFLFTNRPKYSVRF